MALGTLLLRCYRLLRLRRIRKRGDVARSFAYVLQGVAQPLFAADAIRAHRDTLTGVLLKMTPRLPRKRRLIILVIGRARFARVSRI